MKYIRFNKKLNDFYLLQLGQFVSQLGSKMTSFALIIWSFEQSGSVLSTSALTICWTIPSVTLSFLAGSFIDRWDKKKIMLIADTIAAICSLITFSLLISNQLSVWHLYILNIINGMVNAFQDPAASVAVSIIVPKEYYTKTSGIGSFINAFTTTFTPIIATSMYSLLGLNAIIFFDLCTFLFAFTTLLFFVSIPDVHLKKTNKKEKVFDNCKQGMKYIMNRKNIFHLILYMGFVNLIAAIYNSNLTPMILSRNGNNKYELGIVTGTVGVAGIVGSILVSIKKEPKKRIPIIINTMTFSFLICNTSLGIGRNYIIWTIAIFAGNILVPFLTANVEYIMRTKIPLDMQGRVFSARNTLQYISIPIGYLFGGLLTDKVFEPFMKKESFLQQVITGMVGGGRGSGSAFLFVIIGIAGFLGCCIFRQDKYMKTLDE